MPLEVSETEFVEEWKACWKDMERDTTHLFDMVWPYFSYLKSMFLDTAMDKDVTYLSLCNLLAFDFTDPLTAISDWIMVVGEENLEQQLAFLFLKRLRKVEWKPVAKTVPRIAEYAIARDFKYEIRRDVVRHLKKGKSKIMLHTVPIEEEHHPLVEDTHADYLLIKNISSSFWQTYLFNFILNGYNALEIADISKIPRETFYYEDKKAWHNLRKNS